MDFVYKIVIKQPDYSYDTQIIESTPSFELFTVAEKRGWRYMQPYNRPSARPELIGHPMFFGLNGPMYDGFHDGRHVIRYEGNV